MDEYRFFLTDYLPDFMKALTAQLEKDQKKWGDTWKQRPREGQEVRAFARFHDYEAQFVNAGNPVPWLKVAGEALIAWVRENHEEVSTEEACVTCEECVDSEDKEPVPGPQGNPDHGEEAIVLRNTLNSAF